MSGVYIDGMGVPTNCGSCIFWDPSKYRLADCLATERTVICRYDERPDDCPLIPVPDHGRVGDLDALLASYDKEHKGNPGRARTLIANAPTIIPADRREGDG